MSKSRGRKELKVGDDVWITPDASERGRRKLGRVVSIEPDGSFFFVSYFADGGKVQWPFHRDRLVACRSSACSTIERTTREHNWYMRQFRGAVQNIRNGQLLDVVQTRGFITPEETAELRQLIDLVLARMDAVRDEREAARLKRLNERFERALTERIVAASGAET